MPTLGENPAMTSMDRSTPLQWAKMIYWRGMDKDTAQFKFTLPVVFIREGAQVVAYTPALDISTSGKDEAEAKAHFAELVNIFFKDLVENRTLDTVLTELGWSRENRRWTPPAMSQESVNVEVPAFA